MGPPVPRAQQGVQVRVGGRVEGDEVREGSCESRVALQGLPRAEGETAETAGQPAPARLGVRADDEDGVARGDERPQGPGQAATAAVDEMPASRESLRGGRPRELAVQLLAHAREEVRGLAE